MDVTFGSGNDINGSRIKKCPGVNYNKSVELLDNGVIEREFGQASIFTSTVFVSSNVNNALPSIW